MQEDKVTRNTGARQVYIWLASLVFSFRVPLLLWNSRLKHRQIFQNTESKQIMMIMMRIIYINNNNVMIMIIIIIIIIII